MKVVAIRKGYINGRLWEPDKGDEGPFEIPDEPVNPETEMPMAFSKIWMKVYVPQEKAEEVKVEKKKAKEEEKVKK
ncbi:hypothetical protein LCGC14_0414180 [marine sediment metagenome]|uniref:Uncharacterized protein n=1 Tax=marine sediment metagenome TaxID=412755 RepID=A0A0F9TAY7_9ZZZZ